MEEHRPRLEVVAAAIERHGRWLLGRRSGGELHGLWEFPGGKVESGESPAAALARELREELGIEVVVEGRLATVLEERPDVRLRLHLHRCRLVAGEPVARVHAGLGWYARAELEAGTVELAAADRALLARLGRGAE